MVDENDLREYEEWVNEATSKSELKEILQDIRNDILDDGDDNEGGRVKTLMKKWSEIQGRT